MVAVQAFTSAAGVESATTEAVTPMPATISQAVLGSSTFGLDGAIGRASAMPFFIGVVRRGSTVLFVLSRLPLARTDAMVTRLCLPDGVGSSGPCTSDRTAMILSASPLVLSDWADQPITPIGWVQGTYAPAGSGWNFNLRGGLAGFGYGYEKARFALPATEVLLSPSALRFPGNIYTYRIDRNGSCEVEFQFSGPVTRGGVEATYLMLPYGSSESRNAIEQIGYYDPGRQALHIDLPTGKLSRMNTSTSYVDLTADLPDGLRGRFSFTTIAVPETPL